MDKLNRGFCLISGDKSWRMLVVFDLNGSGYIYMTHKRLLFISLVATAAMMIAQPLLAGFDKVNLAREAALADVGQIYIAEVAVADTITAIPRLYPKNSWEPRSVSERDSLSRAQALRTQLQRALGKRFKIVDAPGAGVLEIQPELTKLSSSRPTMADYRRQQGLSFDSIYAGGAAVKMRLLRDGQEVAMIEDRHDGSLGDGLSRIAIWQDADRAFIRWGRLLSEWLDKR